MKMKNILLILIVLGNLFPVLAQDGITNRKFINEVYQIDEHIKRQDKGVNYDDTDTYSGTPYNHPSYLPGNVYKDNELLATEVALRYNAMADEMEIKESLTTPDEQAKVLTKSPDIFVKINSDIYVFVPYKGGIEGGGYFHVLHEGSKYDLFKKPSKKFTPEKKASSSITRDTPANFSDRPVYYIVTKDGKFYELPSTRSKKLKVFAENKDLIKDYVKEMDLDINEENDLIKIIQYYDSLGK
jgi:hypothetical protein